MQGQPSEPRFDNNSSHLLKCGSKASRLVRSRWRLLALGLIPLLVFFAGCTRAAKPAAVQPVGPSRVAPPPTSKTLLVFAAASLTETFNQLKQTFEAAHPGVQVKDTYAGTQALRVQVEQGARCDVFCSASKQHMEALLKEKLVKDPRVFAHNLLCVVIYPKQSKVKTLRDLAKPGVRLVVATATCPVGRYTRQCWTKMTKTSGFGSAFVAAMKKNVASEETNVKLVVSKVEMGEADAGFVYVSDALGRKVKTISLPETVQVKATYMAGVGSSAPQPQLARAYLDLLTGPEGAALLKKYGLEPVQQKTKETTVASK